MAGHSVRELPSAARDMNQNNGKALMAGPAAGTGQRLNPCRQTPDPW